MINKKLDIVCMVAAFLTVSSVAQAASVKCSFMSETQISPDGTWLKTETDISKLIKIFGDGLELPLENSLLGNLDTKLPFFAGETERGKVYLMGGPIGVQGKNISVEGDVITIYDGMCTISFG